MLNTNFQIVEYTVNNADNLLETWNNANRQIKEYYKGINEEVLKHKPSCGLLNYYLVIDDDKVVGLCKLTDECYCGEEDALFLDYMEVDEEYRGKGAGKMLILKSLERALELGFPRVDLTTMESNTNAIGLYGKCGFVRTEYHIETIVHMVNSLPASGQLAIDELINQLNL